MIDYFSFTSIALTGQCFSHSRHAEQLLGFTTMIWSSKHSKTENEQASIHFLHVMQF